MQRQVTDEKDNYIEVTLFESWLSLFMLEHPEFYKDIYCKLLDAIENFINTNRKSKHVEFCLKNIFSDLNDKWPGCDSFANLKKHFSLLAADTCIKFCAEAFFCFKQNDSLVIQTSASSTLTNLCMQSLFSKPLQGQKKLSKHLRCDDLFSEKNRGVIISDETDKKFSHDFGIVSLEHTPAKFQHYFSFPVHSARFTYSPNLSGYVATWLTERCLPIISGASGSTEVMMSRLLPLVDLSHEETKILLLAQTASMIAMGHHSFFECMLVADRFGYKLGDPDKMSDLYLQCIPKTILLSEAFQDFLTSDEGLPLLMFIPYDNSEDSLSSSNSGSFVVNRGMLTRSSSGRSIVNLSRSR